MRSFWFFIQTTVKGGIFFFFPLVFIGIVIQKAEAVLSAVIGPLAAKFGMQNLLGKATLGILVAIAILVICFCGGLLMRVKQLKKINEKLAEFIIKLFPKYKNYQPKPAKKS